tara:strand:+ start:1215 stop:1889 length:675 start_codon:yes stop_codon:yes gene_type:complete
MSGLEIVTGPTIEPISRTEGREHLRLDDDIDDSQIRSYITASRMWAENYTGRTLISTTYAQYLNGYIDTTPDPYWEGTITGPSLTSNISEIELAASPAISVTNVKYFKDDNTEHTWASSNYYVDIHGDVGKIVLRDNGTFPSDIRAANGIKVNFVAGYGTKPNSVPEPIRMAILQYMSFMYEHRGDDEGRAISLPPIIPTLLNPYKIMRFGSTPYQKIYKTGIS